MSQTPTDKIQTLTPNHRSRILSRVRINKNDQMHYGDENREMVEREKWLINRITNDERLIKNVDSLEIVRFV